jgi:hypothetical protein
MGATRSLLDSTGYYRSPKLSPDGSETRDGHRQVLAHFSNERQALARSRVTSTPPREPSSGDSPASQEISGTPPPRNCGDDGRSRRSGIRAPIFAHEETAGYRRPVRSVRSFGLDSRLCLSPSWVAAGRLTVPYDPPVRVVADSPKCPAAAEVASAYPDPPRRHGRTCRASAGLSQLHPGFLRAAGYPSWLLFWGTGTGSRVTMGRW